MSMQKVLDGSELELAKVAIEYWTKRGRGALERPVGPSVNSGEVVSALFLGLVEV